MPKVYTLTVTEEQAASIRDACELLSRCYMAQTEHVLWEAAPNAGVEARYLTDSLNRVIELARDAKSGMGIDSPLLPAKPRVAWSIYQVIRHRLAWDALPPGTTERPSWQVMYDAPFNPSGEPMPTMEATDAD